MNYAEVRVRDVKLNVYYEYDPGERMVMYYSDGSGYPGSPPAAAIHEVRAGDVDIYELLSDDLLEYIEEQLIYLNS